MHVSVSDAKGQLTELVRRAEAGEEIVLTRHGRPAVRLNPVAVTSDRATRLAAIEAARALGRNARREDGGAAESQDFLYGEDGLPG